jgi:5-methyltetrahydrofolate--homocysteine methyltransferase
MPTSLQTLLAADTPVVADGGMGTMLVARGLSEGQAPETWNADRPDDIRQIHRGYIQAGAQLILTNTFGGNRVRLALHNAGDRPEEVNRIGAELARAEADAADHAVVVGGSIGPTGQMMAPLGELSFDGAVAIFEEQARALVAGGVDVLWIETMADLQEVQAAHAGCRRAAPQVPVTATMTFDTRGRTMMGVKPEQAVQTIQQLDVLALGANCGNGIEEILGVIEQMHAAQPGVPLIAKSNAGMPRMEQGKAVYDATPADMAAYARRVRELGATIIGACCGSSPAHIQAIAEALQA